MQSTRATTAPPNYVFNKGFSRTNSTLVHGKPSKFYGISAANNLYDYQTTNEGMYEPTYPVVSMRHRRMYPMLYDEPAMQSSKVHEDHVQEKANNLRDEIEGKHKKNKVSVAIDEVVDAAMEKGKIKRKDISTALDALTIK